MADKPYISLEPSEGVIVQTAGQIYAAYIAAGHVNNDNTKEWIGRSIREAVQIARTVDDAIQSDSELG